jgi:hypothetical protein
MSNPPAVIRAAAMFTKNGNSKNVNLIGELAAGLTLGLGVGLIWKVCVLLVRVLPPVFIYNSGYNPPGSTVLHTAAPPPCRLSPK